MKNEPRENSSQAVELTPQTLEDLKNRGFRYVRVDAFTQDKRSDYMEPRYFMLEPIKDLPDDVNKKGIYEPINSDLLTEWANSPHEGIKVYVTKG